MAVRNLGEPEWGAGHHVTCRRVDPPRPHTAGARPPGGYREGALRVGAGVNPAPLGWSLESESAMSSIGVPGAGVSDPSGLRP